MKKRKLIESYVVLSLISLMFILVLSDAIIPSEAFARSEYGYYEQKIEWNQTYGGSGFDYAFTFIQTADGGFALAGVTNSYGAGESDMWLLGKYDMWLVKTDVNGIVEWNQTYGGTEHDGAYSVIQTTDGGFALAGLTRSYGVGESDMWLIKNDVNGVAQWNRTYGGIGSDVAYSVIQTTDRGFALAGFTASYGAGESVIWLIKTDANGIAQWNQTYGGTEGEAAYSVIQTTDGGFALAGDTWSYGAGESDIWLIKTDTNGVAQWDRTYGGIGSDSARALISTTDGGFALAGGIDLYSTSEYDMWLIKTDANGVAQWNQTYGGTEGEAAYSVIQTADGGFALAGDTWSYGAGESDMWLIKIKPTSILEALLAPLLSLSLIGLILFFIILFFLIIVIKKQKGG